MGTFQKISDQGLGSHNMSLEIECQFVNDEFVTMASGLKDIATGTRKRWVEAALLFNNDASIAERAWKTCQTDWLPFGLFKAGSE